MREGGTRRRRAGPATGAVFLLALAALDPAAGWCQDRFAIGVSILPQRSFVELLGGERVAVQVVVQPGHSPATYEPTPKQVARLAATTVYISIGVAFEQALLPRLRTLAPDLLVIDGAQEIELVPMAGRHQTEAADPGADHTHSDGGLDPHFWLDPSLVATHLHTVCDTLCGVAPQHCGEFRGNLIRATAKLEAVDRRVAATLAPFAGRALFVFHPAYGYFARRYSLRQLAVEIEGKEPTARQLAGLIDAARAERVRAVFVQPQFSGRSARAVAEAIGVELVELDPLAADPIANLEIMAAAIAAAYGG